MNYIDWHYFEAWPKLIIVLRNMTLFPFYFFSIPLHLKTLFSPWKRQVIAREKAFSFGNYFSVLSFNLFSRIVGASVRLAVIFCALFLMILFFTISLLLTLLWVIIPGVTLPIYLLTETKNHETKSLIKKSKGDAASLAYLIFNTPMGRFVLDHLAGDHNLLLAYLKKQKKENKYILSVDKLISSKEDLKLSYLFYEITDLYPPLVQLFQNINNIKDDLYETACWYELINQGKQPLLFNLKRIKSLPGIGTEWAYGYTWEFDKFAQDVTNIKTAYPLLLGREKEITKIEESLIKIEENNVLIVGEPGVGRHIIIKALAYRMKTGNCLPSLSHKRILNVDMHSLIASLEDKAHVKGFLSKLITEAEQAGNIVIFIDEIDRYLGGDTSFVDLTDVVEKLGSSSVSFIGITTPSAFYKTIQLNATLDKLFEKVTITTLPVNTVLLELKASIVPVLEKKHNITITLQSLKKVLENAEKFISTTPFPGKAIELLEESCVYVKIEKKKSVLLASHIDEYLSEKFHILIGELESQEREKLVNLETLLHKRIINQKTAINALSSSLRRSRLAITSAKRPRASFLFLGPTGVGKTETAKALSQVYFQDESHMLRFDMSQYQKEEGLERLIGSAKTGTPGELTSCLADYPFSLLLFDEIEKADKGVTNLLLTLIDEGYIVNHQGKKVDARNTIIIATSNAGSEYIRESVNLGETGSSLRIKLIDYVQKEHVFSPEFINRFDQVVVFTHLSEGHLKEVAKLMLKDLNKRLTQKGISVAVTEDLVNKLSIMGHNPQFGAREMRRVISETIEDQVAQKLLSQSVNKGEEIKILL